MAKAPSLQFYPGDVQRDTGLSSVSLQAFGLWHKMLWAMFDGTPFGHLSVNGSVIPPDNLSRLLRVTPAELDAGLRELEEAQVFSKTDAGVIFCRRMVRDAHRREVNAVNGSKGGNPRLSKSVKRKDIRQDIPLTADAVSNTVLNSERKERANAAAQPPFTSPEFLQALTDFEDMRKAIKKPATPAARQAIFRKLQAMGEAAAIVSLQNSTIGSWTDVYPPKPERMNAPMKPEHSAERKDLKTTW